MNVNLDLTQVLITVLTLVLSWGLKKGSDLLDARAAAAKQRSQHEKLDKYIDLAVKAIEDSVRATNITVVDDLKAAAVDGKLTKEEADQILTDSVANILKVLSQDSRDVLSMVYGDLPAWIQTKIINAVEDAKSIDPTVVVPDNAPVNTSVVNDTPVVPEVEATTSIVSDANVAPAADVPQV